MHNQNALPERLRWLCLDCGRNTFEHTDDWYLLPNRLWRQLVPREQRHGMICRACIERRLGGRSHRMTFEKPLTMSRRPKISQCEKRIMELSTR